MRSSTTVAFLQRFKFVNASIDDLTREGRAKHRERRMAFTVIAALGARGGSLASTLITVPLLFHYLGDTNFGLWVVLTASLSWASLAQLGINSSLLNLLAPRDNQDSRGKSAAIVATAWWLQTAVALVLVATLLLSYPVVPWRELLGVDVNISPSALRLTGTLLWLGACASLPAAVAQSTFRARQEGYLANLWELVRVVITVCSLIAAMLAGQGLVGLGAAYCTASLFFSLGTCVHAFCLRDGIPWPSPRNIDKRLLGPLLRPALQFTVISAAGLIISYSDTLVIAHVLGTAKVASYAVVFTFVHFFVSLEMVLLDAAWPAYAEAAARGEGDWTKRMHFRLLKANAIGALLFAACLVFAAAPLIRIWAGTSAEPPTALLATMALMVSIQSVALCYGRLLTALGHVRTNMCLGVLNAAVNLPLSIALAHLIGLPGVALGTAIAYLIVGGLAVLIGTRRLEDIVIAPRRPAVVSHVGAGS